MRGLIPIIGELSFKAMKEKDNKQIVNIMNGLGGHGL